MIFSYVLANSTKTMTSFQCDTAPYGKRQAQNPALATSQTPANDLIPGSQSRAALLKRLSHSRHFSRHAVSEASPAAANEPAWLGQLINGLSRSDEQTSSQMEEHTSELQSRPHISYAVFCLKKKTSSK